MFTDACIRQIKEDNAMETNNTDIRKLEAEEMEKVSAGSDDAEEKVEFRASIEGRISLYDMLSTAYCTSCGNRLIPMPGGNFKCDCKTCSQFGKIMSSSGVNWR